MIIPLLIGGLLWACIVTGTIIHIGTMADREVHGGRL